MDAQPRACCADTSCPHATNPCHFATCGRRHGGGAEEANSASAPRPSATGIATEVGMHKWALLRHFGTRKQILLELTAERGDPAFIANVFAATPTARPMFCDPLAQAPLTLERNVLLEAIRTSKLVTLHEIALIEGELTGDDAVPGRGEVGGGVTCAADDRRGHRLPARPGILPALRETGVGSSGHGVQRSVGGLRPRPIRRASDPSSSARVRRILRCSAGSSVSAVRASSK